MSMVFIKALPLRGTQQCDPGAVCSHCPSPLSMELTVQRGPPEEDLTGTSNDNPAQPGKQGSHSLVPSVPTTSVGSGLHRGKVV